MVRSAAHQSVSLASERSAKEASEEKLKRLNFLRKYNFLRNQNNSPKSSAIVDGSSIKNPIIVVDGISDDEGATVAKETGPDQSKWYHHLTTIGGANHSNQDKRSVSNASVANGDDSRMEEEGSGGSAASRGSRSTVGSRVSRSSPGSRITRVSQLESDSDEPEVEDQYYTFQARVPAKKAEVRSKNAEEELFDSPKPNKFVKFFVSPAEKMKLKTIKGRLGWGDHRPPMDLGLFETDIKSMPMVNAFERNNGEWWEDTDQDESYNTTNEVPDETVSANDSPVRHMQRRSEKFVSPNGETREVIEEEFIERAERGRVDANVIWPRRARAGDRHLNKDYMDNRRRQQFDQRMREYQYYMNGVSIPMPNNGRKKKYETKTKKTLRVNNLIQHLSGQSSRAPRQNRTSRMSNGTTRLMGFEENIWDVLHRNYNEEILLFHIKVRKLLSLIPIVSYIEPSLALFEVAIPTRDDSCSTSPTAMLVAVLDCIIAVVSIYWGIRFYLVVTKFLERILWIFVKVGLL
ncbi:DEKNAAC100305 [Brettanomyces naardenensis]|uniref:DEKNAAC100305 n=1 Tax=Brettanomyces naardenensis TaxID=13370 RepID=A0A448YFW2_BRENA|nr:DEKNAAC100305 [Brettanomyces naardenensis]